MQFHDIRRGRREGARPDRRTRRARRGVGALALEPLEGRVVLSGVSNWLGTTSNLWSVPTNWDNAPAPGNDLSFSSTGVRTANQNDLATDTPFGTVTFSSAGYSITGVEVVLTNAITATQTSGVDAFNVPIQLGNTVSVGVTNAQSTLDLGGIISDNGSPEGLTMSGAGTANLSGANTYTGPTTINAGTLQIDGTQASAVTVNAGGTLAGTGTVPSISSVGGTVSPGDGAPGTLIDSGAFTLDAQSTFSVAVNSSANGEVQAAGPITLAGALSVNLTTTFTANQQITLIHNAGNSGITGQFAGLQEGAEVTFDNQTFQITYKGGTGHDVVLTHLIGTSTTVVSSNPTPTFGTEVTLTATVVGVGGGTPTGEVEFLNGSTPIGSNTVNGSGIATIQLATLPVGTDSITAVYEGDTGFASSTSPPITVTVSKAPTTTALQVQPTSSFFGQSVSLTATVAATTSGIGTPTGTVEFLNGSTEIQTAQLTNGTVTITTSSLPVGTDSITAVYESDDDFATSTSPAVTATISAIPTTSTLQVAPTNPSLGQSVTLTATVAPGSGFTGTPTGTVTFLDGTNSLGTGTLNSSGVATLTTTGLSGGPNVLTASYASDGQFASSVSAAQTITIPQAVSTTALTISPNPSFQSQSVTLTATVSGVNSGGVIPTGTVQFFAGTTSLGLASVTGGVASLQTATLPFGTSSVTAQYQGDVSFTSSTSPAVIAQVTLAATRVTLTPTIANPGPTQTEVFDVSVATGASGVTPTGTVEIFANGAVIGSGPLSSGSATISVQNLPLGNLVIAAVYTGDTTNASSASPAQVLPVGTAVEQYINAIYLNTLGRSVDVGQILKISNGGLAGWLQQYVKASGFRRPVVSHIVQSKETRQFAVQATYQNVTDNAAKASQLQTSFIDDNGTSTNLNSRVFGGAAYYQKVGASIEAYLDALGTDILGEPLPTAFTTLFTAELEHGTPRSTVVRQLLTSNVGEVAQVNGLYQRLLGRAADPSGLKANVTSLSQTKATQQALINLLSSKEFFDESTTAPGS